VLTTGALRHRAGQAIALFVLSMLGVAACAFGPLYERSVEAAQLKVALANTPIFSRGIAVRTDPDGANADIFAAKAPEIRRFYGSPVVSDRLGVTYSEQGSKIVGDVVTRDAACQHMRLLAGRCPGSPLEVMMSSSSARAMGLHVGDQIRVLADQPSVAHKPVHFTLEIVGQFVPYDSHNDYWFDNSYYSTAGAQLVIAGRQDSYYAADSLVAGDGFSDLVAKSLPVTTEIDVPLRVDRVHLDDIAMLRKGLNALTASGSDPNSGVTLSSSLSSVFDQVATGRRAARSVIPALAAETALLVLVVIGIVVAAGAEQRRPEFALARLRGRSGLRTAQLFSREFGVPVILSVIPGLLAAWLASVLACRWWLSGNARPELLRSTVLAAACAVAVVELLIVAFAARATARRPVHDLIRRVPVRVSRRRISVAEAALAAAAIAGTVVVLSGDRRNAIAVITPGLIALLSGMILSHLLALFSNRAGLRLLWRGRLATGLAGLQIARRPGVRRIVVLLCVAAAIAVSAADEWRVSARNRSVRAGAEVGASVALTVRATNLDGLQRAVAAADPSGRYATPVVIQQPTNGPAVVAVSPASFQRIADWGWARNQPGADLVAHLSPPRPDPISLTGTQVELRLKSESISRVPLYGDRVQPQPVSMLLHLYPKSGPDVYARVGPLPEGNNGPLVLSARVPCAGGCRLAQLSILRSTADSNGVHLDVTIAGLYAGARGALHRVALGPATDWGEATPEISVSGADDPTGKISVSADADGSLSLSAFHIGPPEALQHLDVPIAVPAIVTGDADAALSLDDRGLLSDSNIDGIAAAFRPVGRTAFVPGYLGPTLLVDADVAAAAASPTLADSTTAVWLRTDDPARERSLVAALRQHGVSVVSRDTAARHRAALAATAPAWAMQLALLTAVLAVLIAALVILISATMSRRSRASDASALGLVGVEASTLGRATVVEHLIAVVTGVLVGSVIGVLGAHMALPGTPIFLAALPTPQIVHYTAWDSVMFASAVAMAALVVASVATSLGLVRRVVVGRPLGAEQ
jgi:putative ABC transport system permease protein